MYAWIIDKDHLARPGDEPGTNANAVGIMGPSEAPDWMTEVLAERGRVNGDFEYFTFRMYDGDGELYYTGRLLTDDPLGDACMGPLDDYGTPNAGATDIRYQGHPEMDCG